MKKNLKGFTLVEVLIVIIIVGILIAALLPRLVGSQARARDISRQAGVNQISNGVGLLMNDHGALTSTGDDLCISTLGTITAGTSADLGDYMASLPEDPQSTHVNGDDVINGGFATDCAGSYAAVTTNDGSAVFVFATMEGANGNYAQFSGSDLSGSVADMQALAAGTDVFGVVIQ